jgi:hypothetical protein
LVCFASGRTGTKLSRSVAQGLADQLNGVLNRTVSDSRLSITPIAGYPDAFELIRVVDGANASLELGGTTARLYVRLVVVVEDGRCRTESYAYRLQADGSMGSWLVRWEYVRDPPPSDSAYPRAHVHVNGKFPDEAPIGRLHIPTRRMSLELIVRHLITDWDVKPRSDGWEAILDDSIVASGEYVSAAPGLRSK